MEYTAVDAAKEAADIRIIAVDGTFTVISKIALKGRGITERVSPGVYEVSKRAMDKLQSLYDVRTDF